jgi:hypothetical protein
MIGAQNQDVRRYVRTIVRFSQRLNVVGFRVRNTIGQLKRLTTDLALVLVHFFEGSGK